MDDGQFREAVIHFIKEYYKENKKGPAVRKILEKFRTERNVKKRFRKIFGGIAKAYKLAGIPIPEARINQTRKAFEARKKKRVEEASVLRDLKHSYQIQQREEQRREEFSRKHAEETAILLQDPNEAISGPIRDAIENIALPVLFEKKYGIKATVPEILAMLKEYKKAEDEGWYVEYATEWGILSEKGREIFGEICNMNPGGTIGLPDYLSTLKDEIGALISQKKRLLEEVNEIEQKKRKLDWDYSGLKTRYDNLKKNYEEREKRLDNKYYELAKDYGYRFGVVKRQLQDEISKLIKQRDKLSLTMINKKLGNPHNPVKRVNPKSSYHGEIDFKKMWESLGFSVSEQKKKTVA